MKKLGLGIIVLSLTLFAFNCQKTQETETVKNSFKILEFIPGVIAGSPTHELLDKGVKDFAQTRPQVEVKVLQADYDQSKWPEMLRSIAETKSYDLIVTTNPALPNICDAISKNYPNQKFLILDAKFEGNKNIKTISLDAYQQGFLNGYHAALISKSSLKGANKEMTIGLIAGQEYPVMNDEILPGFTAGARAVDQNAKVEFRVVGNWYDPAVGEALASELISKKKVDVILAISGGANVGILKAAQKANVFVQLFDKSNYSLMPQVISGCTTIAIDKATSDALELAIADKLNFGVASTLGIKDRMVSFDIDDENYKKFIPQDIQKNMKGILEGMQKGSIQEPHK